MKKTILFDLDGTLLRSYQKTSDFTNETINRLVSEGMLFSYATARSYIASAPVTVGLDARIPLSSRNPDIDELGKNPGNDTVSNDVQ